uniref:Uncharacterized protein n=1 Tax=Avena sativa TaxID=4498 RepID=A0ACD5U2A5_AVESA
MTMAVEAKHETLCIKRILRCSIRISYRSASEHWALFSLVLLLYLLHRSSPGLFAFILSSSPIIICATLLLGILLSYGSTHLPQTGEDRKPVPGFSAPGFGCCSRDTNSEARHRFSVPAFEENTVSFKCWEIRKPSFGKERDDKLVELDDAVPLLKGSVDQGDDRVDANDTLAEVVTSIPSMVTLHRKIGMEEVMKANHEMESKVPFSSNDKSTEHANLFEDVDQSGADASKAENDAKDGEEKKDDGGNKPAFAWTADEDKNDMDLGYSEVERSRRLEFLMAKRRSRKNIMFDLDRNMIDIDGNDVCQSADRFSRFRMQVQPISVQRRSPFDLASDPDEAAIPGSAPSVMHRQKNLFELPSEQSNDSGVSAHHDLDSQQFATSSHRDMVFRRRDTFNFGSQERQRSTFKPCFVLEAMDMEEESTSSFQRQFSGKSVSKLSVVSESDTLSSAADQEELNDLVKKDFQRWFSDKSMSKLSIVSESDTLSLVADQEEHNDFVMKDIQRWFSDKSMSKLSIVSESDALSLVADQEEHGDLINKEFLWHFHRQFSDKSVSKRTESGTISVVADQEEHSDFNKDFLWYFQRQFSDMSVSKLNKDFL